jgi:hypothetical protein
MPDTAVTEEILSQIISKLNRDRDRNYSDKIASKEIMEYQRVMGEPMNPMRQKLVYQKATIAVMETEKSELEKKADVLINSLAAPRGTADTLSFRLRGLLSNTAPQAATDSPIPYYVGELIKDGHVDTDGKTVLTTIDKVAAHAFDNLDSDFTKKHLARFRQQNGKPFSKDTIEKAVTAAKNQ